MTAIDLNADLGEGAGTDSGLMALVSSANVCCGAHAGDPDGLRATLELAKQHGVRVGAHPGYADRDHFGRRDLDLSDKQLGTLVFHQVGGLDGLARLAGLRLSHLKPHGALYNQAGRDLRIARPIAGAAALFGLALVGLPGSQLETAASAVGVRFIPEGFADRRYRPDGTLVPRTEPDALIHDPAEAATQAEWLVRAKGVRTICVHGDTPDAVAFVAAVRAVLTGKGVRIEAP